MNEAHIQFRRQLVENLTLSQLKDVCHDFQIDWQQLREHDHKPGLVRGLLRTVAQRDRLADLYDYCTAFFPLHTWTNPCPPLAEEQAAPAAADAPPNPFYVGGRLNQPDHFFGRAGLQREMRQTLRNRASVSLVGPSRIGKSSLLYYLYLTRAQWADEMQVAYIDLQGVVSQEDFCETVLLKIGQPEGNTPYRLKRGLRRYEGVLLLDEVERLSEDDFDPRLTDLLRSQAQDRHLSLCTAARTPLDTLFPDAGLVSPFHNIFTPKQMRPFSRAESLDFLDWALRRHPFRFDAAQKETLYTRTQGHPAELQAAAQQLYRQTFER